MSFALAITAVNFFKYVGYFIVAIICFMFMVVIHEAGHFWMGRLLKFKINEFAVGFGPKIIKYKSKKTGTVFSLRAILFGGFCAFEGESEDNPESTESFNSQKPWKRILVLIAGATTNFISAIILIAIFFASYGDVVPQIEKARPVTETQNVAYVQPLKEGDIILKINGKRPFILLSQDKMQKIIKNDKDDKLDLLILRDGKKQKIEVLKGKYTFIDENGNEHETQGYGMQYSFTQIKYSFFDSIAAAFSFSFRTISTLFSIIGSLFTRAIPVKGSVGGPVLLVKTMMQITMGGFGPILYALCVFSATLAIMNLLPFPALDGSKVVFTTIEWIRGKPINRKVENWIHLIGFFALILLSVILDIYNWV